MKNFLFLLALSLCSITASHAAAKTDPACAMMVFEPGDTYAPEKVSAAEEEKGESGITAGEIWNVASDTELIEAIIISRIAGSDVKVKNSADLVDYFIEKSSGYPADDYIRLGKQIAAPGIQKTRDLIRRIPGSGCLKSILRNSKQKAASDRQHTSAQMRQIYTYHLPKPPKATGNLARWDIMTVKWFFSLGQNPSFYPQDSPQSIDIANSYSMSELKKTYFATGKMPETWVFTGPGSATGKYGEVEWFIGSYHIEDFQLENGIATFKVRNLSCWHSGTRLPKTWSHEIERLTDRQMSAIVNEPPTGKRLKYYITRRFPVAGRIPGFNFLMRNIPTFGQDWEQVYEIKMEWKP